jgi:hypothetical protein
LNTRELNYDGEKTLIIYLSKEEENNQDTMYRMSEYRKKYRYTIVFVSGNTGIENVLSMIVKVEAT